MFKAVVEDDDEDTDSHEDLNSTETSIEQHKVFNDCINLLHDKALRFRLLQVAENHGIGQDGSDSDNNDDEDMSTLITLAADFKVHPKESLCGFFKAETLEILRNGLFLRRKQHVDYLLRQLKSLPPSLLALDASKPWIIYWIIHSIAVLGELSHLDKPLVINYLQTMKDLNWGGYGGGVGQLSHLATTYAAICTLIELQDTYALKTINRADIYSFIKSMQDPITEGFFLHTGGELDVRGAYCAVAVASLLNLDTHKLFNGLGNYIKSLQSFEGGLAGEPGLESHGGYTYCGLAALSILEQHEVLDLNKLLYWAVHRQCDITGAFQGRINKLPDSCYSFWGAGILTILSHLGIVCSKRCDDDINNDNGICDENVENNNTLRSWFNPFALQTYILGCCQDTFEDPIIFYKGGLRDKPGESQDLYHTCYSLSGLSLCQHCVVAYNQHGDPDIKNICENGFIDDNNNNNQEMNRVQPIHPLYNITWDAWKKAQVYFKNIGIYTDDNT